MNLSCYLLSCLHLLRKALREHRLHIAPHQKDSGSPIQHSKSTRMAETSFTPSKVVQITTCTTHEAPVAMGCTACLKFFCPMCLNKEPWCEAVQGSHIMSVIEEVVKTIKSELDQNLKSVQKTCDLLEEDGRSVLEELDNEKKTFVELIDAERAKVINYLQEVREKSELAKKETELFMKSDEVSLFVKYTIPNVNMPEITLKNEGFPLSVHIEDRANLLTKSLRFVSSPVYDGELRFLLRDGRLLTTEHYTDHYNNIYRVRSYSYDQKGQPSASGPLISSYTYSPQAVSADGSKIVTKDDGFGRLYISTPNKTHTINRKWAGSKTNVIWMNEDQWILFFAANMAWFYSCVNSADYTLRKNIKFELDTNPKSFTLDDTHFCFYSTTKLDLYQFSSSTLSTEQIWSFSAAEGQTFTAGCYSQDYQKILLADKKGIVVIEPLTGQEMGRLETPELGLEKKIIKLSLSRDLFIFQLSSPAQSSSNKVSIYKLEG